MTWQARRTVSVETVPDPVIKEPTDAIIKITSTNICGSDPHLSESLTAFMGEATSWAMSPWASWSRSAPRSPPSKAGDRVVIPFQMSCGHCLMCDQKLFSQCETTQVRDQGTGAALFGSSKLYDKVPGGQAEYLRVPIGPDHP